MRWVSEVDPYPEEFVMHGLTWSSLPGVFPSTITSGTEVFSHIVCPDPGETFCEVGCGSGVISVMAAMQGKAQVTALDINPAAIDNCRVNAERHNVTHRMTCLVSDLFSEVPPSSSFDTIFWNVPWGLAEPSYQYVNDLERAVFDPGYSLQRRYMTEGRAFLRDGGQQLLGTTDIGDIELLNSIAAEADLKLQEVARVRRIEVNQLMTYIVYRVDEG
ncbi:methyltransferase [Nocardia ninae]